MENTVQTMISGGGQGNLSSLTGFGAGREPFGAAGNNNRKVGFTLAEVLITLGIIGVVAAMTLPALTAKKQTKELETSLKKNYSIIQQAINKMSYDEGGTVKAGNYAPVTFYKPFSKYFNIIKACGIASCVGAENKEIDGEVIKWYIDNYKTYSKSRNVATDYFDDGQIVLTDGSFYMIENPNNSTNYLFITVDVNGYNKKPNAWGHDLFTFEITKTGKFLPMGAEGTVFTDNSTYCSRSSSHRLNGISCTYKALTDKSYWKNLP